MIGNCACFREGVSQQASVNGVGWIFSVQFEGKMPSLRGTLRTEGVPPSTGTRKDNRTLTHSQVERF